MNLFGARRQFGERRAPRAPPSYVPVISYVRRAFAVAGPMTFNALPDDLRDPSPSVSTATFGRSLKTRLHCISTFRGVLRNAVYKSALLTYLQNQQSITYNWNSEQILYANKKNY